MAKTPNSKAPAKQSSAIVGYDARLWQLADALRGSMDAAEYKHVCFGLLFFNYISDAFEERQAKLFANKKSDEFYIPRWIVKLLVEKLKPYRGPACGPNFGSGGKSVQCEKHNENHAHHGSMLT